MSRVPHLDGEKLSPEQLKVYDAIVTGPRAASSASCGLWLQSPGLPIRAHALGAFCRFGTSLPPRLSEFAIMVTMAGNRYQDGVPHTTAAASWSQD